jgi:hypothetical protein
MDGNDVYTSCSPWRRRLGGLNHVRVVAGPLVGWGHRLSNGAVSHSVALVLSLVLLRSWLVKPKLSSVHW